VRAGRPCRACEEFAVPFRLHAFAQYRSPLTSVILHLKYRPDQELADVVAGWLAETCMRKNVSADIIVPVPLSVKRYRQRGYNQVELIAKSLSRNLCIPCLPRVLHRHRETGSQVGLDAGQREENVRDAFHAHTPIHAHQNVLLIDDLVTTGSTIFAYSRALAEAGVSSITAVAVGRAEERFHC
jgi:ComF family protein